MITFKYLRFPFEVCVPHTVKELVTDIILNITSQEDLMLTLFHIGSRLFELFGKEVRVKKQPGRPLSECHCLLTNGPQSHTNKFCDPLRVIIGIDFLHFPC